MRRLLILSAMLLLAAGTSLAGVEGTLHDVRATTGSDEICIHCHTPHNSSIAVPLWNHTLSSATNYTYYDSDTMDVTVAEQDASAGITGLCMSCHDGTVGIGSLLNDLQDTDSNPTNTTATITGVGLLGVNLTNDHPVGFTYTDATDTDGELVGSPSGNGVQLFNGRVECASCHDPHNSTAGEQPFLVAANTGSVICTTCHQK